jgi:hypothetical protein
MHSVDELLETFRLILAHDAAAFNAPVEMAALVLHHRTRQLEKCHHLGDPIVLGSDSHVSALQ